MINKLDFVNAIAGNINQEARADWIFSPWRIREIFQQYFEKEFGQDMVEMF